MASVWGQSDSGNILLREWCLKQALESDGFLAYDCGERNLRVVGKGISWWGTQTGFGLAGNVHVGGGTVGSQVATVVLDLQCPAGPFS